MDNRDEQANDREENQLRVDILADRLEFYRLTSIIFFRRLSKEEKIDALIEVAGIFQEHNGIIVEE